MEGGGGVARSKDGSSVKSEMKKEGVSFVASLQEGWQKFKASITGLVKLATARTEEEASKAELEAAKAQVEAADAAERKKHAAAAGQGEVD